MDKASQELIDKVTADYDNLPGDQKLWQWFGLSRAAWLTIPRVLMHGMSPEWQGKMAALLDEFDDEFGGWADMQYYVTAKDGRKFAPLPEALCNYRHPRKEDVDAYRKVPREWPSDTQVSEAS